VSAESVSLPVPLSVATGADQSVAGLREKAVQVTGTFSATLSIEISLDGTNFAPIAATTDLTAPALISIPFLAQAMRVDTTVYASGTPLCTVLGDNPRTS
jgi:hypothetical protein